MKISRIRLNKNRGWRGLAELVCEDNERKEVAKSIFSFSQPMWDDLLRGYIVMENEDKYIIINFDNTETLPKPTQQRSVLIKSFMGTVINTYEYDKSNWRNAESDHWSVMMHFIKNRNNHTTSDWNCIGIRVIPEI